MANRPAAVSERKRPARGKKKAPAKASASAPAKPARHPAAEGLPQVYVHDPERDGPARETWWRRPPAPPCPTCKATNTVHGSQAVICNGIRQVIDDIGKVSGEVAYCLCRVCGARFELDVVDPAKLGE